MPFIPHTSDEVKSMLATIGVQDIDTLFDEIPANLRGCDLSSIPEGLSEMDLVRLMTKRAKQNVEVQCFVGAGSYEHHIPAAVWEITGRGEFYTAYTPYQAEASQGTLQLLYEYQSMMCQLTAMDASNASLYDGGSALAEAILMAVRANRKSRSHTICIFGSVNPAYRACVQTLIGQQQIRIIEVPYCTEAGNTPLAALKQFDNEDITAVVIPYPNFFGVLEDVDPITDWAHTHQAMVIASVNPTALALLKPPGEWGERGADIVCGEGQPLGIPLSFGGPYFGFICCKQAYVRQMPGRIIGRTSDQDGNTGFSLTLQAREQHIRRGKATSNICTNQGLMVTAATIYLSILGDKGLTDVALQSYHNTQLLLSELCALPGVERAFTGSVFHEGVIRLDTPVGPVLDHLLQAGYLGGYALENAYPELKNCLLVCATETKTIDDIQAFAAEFQQALVERSGQPATDRTINNKEVIS